MIEVRNNDYKNCDNNGYDLDSNDFSNGYYSGLIPDGWYRKRSNARPDKYAYICIRTHTSTYRTIVGISGDGLMMPVGLVGTAPTWFDGVWARCVDQNVVITMPLS
jgi:hypothetical protein